MKNKQKSKSTLQKNNDDDILLMLLDDSRITSKQIELYNLAKKEFVNIENPIYIIEHNHEMLIKHNEYLKNLMDKTLTDEQINKCLNNSYIQYLRYMLNI